MKYLCPVCLRETLNKPPYDNRGIGSDDICPECRFQFGLDDFPNVKFNIARWRLYWRYINLKMDISNTDPFDSVKYTDIQRKVRVSDKYFPDDVLVKKYFIPRLTLRNLEDWDVLCECHERGWLTDQQIKEYCSDNIELFDNDIADLVVAIAFESTAGSDLIADKMKKLSSVNQSEEPLHRRLAAFVGAQVLDAEVDFFEKYSELIDFLIIFEECSREDVFSVIKNSDFPSRKCYDELVESSQRVINK